MDIKIKVGQRIKELRKTILLSQESLANKADVDRTYVTDVENGRRNVSVEILERSFAKRSGLLKKFPGSLLIARQAVSSGWNLADALFDSSQHEGSSEQAAQFRRREIEVRELAVAIAERTAIRDPGPDSWEDHRVMAIKLAYAWYLAGAPEKTVEVMRQLDKTSGIADFGEDHGSGIELVCCIAVLNQHSPESRFRELLLTQLDLVQSRFAKYRNNETNNVRAIMAAARLTENNSLFDSVRSTEAWTKFQLEVNERFEALPDKRSP